MLSFYRGEKNSFFCMTQFRILKRALEEFQTPDTRPAKEHFHDLIYTTFCLYNAICNALRKGDMGCCVDTAAKASKLMAANSSMREKLSVDEVTMKQSVFHFYLHEGIEMGVHNYRLPTRAKTFADLREKDNRAKDMALHVVIKMYRIWCKGDLKGRSSRHPNCRHPIGAPWSIYSNYCCRPGQPCRTRPDPSCIQEKDC